MEDKKLKTQDVSETFDLYLSQEVKTNMQQNIYTTLHDVSVGVLCPVVQLFHEFKKGEETFAIKAMAEKVNYLYKMDKVWCGFFTKCLIISEENSDYFTILTIPLVNGGYDKMEEIKDVLSLSPLDLLKKHGHIVKFRDGAYANYFENSLGRFFVYDNCVCGFNIDKLYDENLLYLERNKDFCDVVEIYKVSSPHFFVSNFEGFKRYKNMKDEKLIKGDSIELIFVRQ